MKNPFNPKPWEKDPVWQRDNYSALHEEAAGVWKNVQALRAILANVRKDAVVKLGRMGAGPGNVDTLQNRIAEVRFRAARDGQELAAVESLLRAALDSEEFKMAEREYAPLVKAAEAQLAREEAERLAKQRAEAALAAAREAAKERALANLESDREVVAARERLERSAIAAS